MQEIPIMNGCLRIQPTVVNQPRIFMLQIQPRLANPPSMKSPNPQSANLWWFCWRNAWEEKIKKRLSGWWFHFFKYFQPYLGKWSNLTNIFQLGWNHQLVVIYITLKVVELIKLKLAWSRWWQTQGFLEFSLRKLGEDDPILTCA